MSGFILAVALAELEQHGNYSHPKKLSEDYGMRGMGRDSHHIAPKSDEPSL